MLDRTPIAPVKRVSPMKFSAPAMYRPARFAMISRIFSGMDWPISLKKARVR